MDERTLFGTDGIRGKANIFPMTCEIATALGRAVTHYFQKQKSSRRPTIIIGKDTRLSCYMLEQAFSAGVCSQGGRAILTGPLPTPGVAFAIESMRADAGVMISASHNHYYDNGIKIFDRTGHKLPDDIEKELQQMVLNPSLIPIKIDDALGRTQRLDEVVGRYLVHVKSVFDEKYDLEGLKLIVDGANGAGYRVAPLVFEELGAEVLALGNHPNGQNINLDCGALYPQNCALAVKKHQADLGICIDGDGDRLVIIDGKGNIMAGDQILGLCARLLLQKGQLSPASEVVGTIMTNLGLEHYLESLGLTLFRTKVGDRYIVERMQSSGATFGGEPSGHIVFKKFSTTGDGILAALKVLEALKFFKQDIASLCSAIKLYPQKLINIPIKEKIPLEKDPIIQKEISAKTVELGSKGRLSLRYSGTESLLRLMVEGADESLVNKISQDLHQVILKRLS